MADRFWSVVLGEHTHDKVTEGGSSSSEAIELRVEYDATGIKKEDVLFGIDAIKAAIIKDTWPPV